MAPNQPEQGGFDNPATVGANGVVQHEQGGRDGTNKKPGCGERITNKINRALENYFAGIGYVVATHPIKTIIISIACSCLCLIGLLDYTVENRGEKLWVSQSSDSLKHKDWVEDKFPAQFRSISVMLENNGGNILTKDGLKKLMEIHDLVTNANTTYEHRNGSTVTATWENICYRTAGDCIPKSILELWNNNETVIETLTEDDILAKLNEMPLISPMTGQQFVRSQYVGSQQVGENNTVKSASVLRIDFRQTSNLEFDEGQGAEIDERANAFEEKAEGLIEEKRKNLAGYTLYSWTIWLNNKVAGDTTSGDLQFFVGGYILVIIYLSVMLGSFSRVGHKIYLAFAGILVIALSFGVSYGLGSAFQLKKTAVHDVLPFLLLGIGVDDVFVIVQNWDNVGGPSENDGRSIPDKIANALRHAGVSILVTSVTDVCAFLIGASTILPALQSFCIFAAIGIISVFILTITLFVALLSLDARRQQSRRDACLCCITLSDNWEAMECSKNSYLQLFIEKYYGPAILSIPGKIVVLLIAVGLTSAGIYGVTELEQNFDPSWFQPPGSAPRQFAENQKIFFPNNGERSAVYTGKIDYYNEYKAMDNIYNRINNDQYVTSGTVESWYLYYHIWLNSTKSDELLNRTNTCQQIATGCRAKNESLFYDFLHEFLDDQGKFFVNNIQFLNNYTIDAARIPFTHKLFTSSPEEVKGMDSVQEEIKPGTIASETDPLLPFVYSPEYIGWETNKVISTELGRNVGLAVACVFVVTLFLLSNLWASLLVLSCVGLSLLDLMGYMHFWDLTIDTVTTIILVLSIGITVDYSAHIGHAFMAARKGDKNARMLHALKEIAPAVIHGGMSTLLAFILLAASDSYVFESFFKVFLLVVIFGMFHGLFFLPVSLSLIGPKPYAIHNEDEETGHKNKQTKQNKTKTVELDEPVRLEKYKADNQMFTCDEDIKQNGHVEHEKELKPVPEYDHTKDSYAEKKENTYEDARKQSENAMENTNKDTKDNPVYEKDGEVSPTFTIEY